MANININTGEAAAQIDSIYECKKKISNSMQEITILRNDLKKNHTVFHTLANIGLKNLNDKLLTEAAKLDSLAKALQYIVKEYEKTEDLITSETVDREMISDVTGANILSGLSNFIDWLKRIFNWQEESPENAATSKEEAPPAEVTATMEKEKDLAMQQEIFDLLKTNQYSEATWNAASIEERKQILKSFLVTLSGIYGVNVSTEIEFVHKGKNSGNRGGYTHSTKTVIINVDRLERKDSYELMQTMIHEMRHAYQHSAVDNPEKYTVSKETLKQWEDNFAYYKRTEAGYTYSEYVSQPVEWDAKNFAKQYSDLSKANPTYEGSWSVNRGSIR